MATGKQKTRPSKFAAIILAAGTSSRMGKENKLLKDLNGRPMICHVVEKAVRAALGPVFVVLGSDAGKIREVLSGYDVRFVENPDYAMGMSTSIKAGVKAVQSAESIEGAFIMLGDMPLVQARTLKALADALSSAPLALAAAPYRGDVRGNPVLWHRQAFSDLMALGGDQGARTILARLGAKLLTLDVGDPGILMDADTPEALSRLRSQAGLEGEG